MDNDESRDREESRQAAASPSPSALSTASSGSPLVRGASAIGAPIASRRPAPTSIAAAQLQCQQQQQRQLEFSNKLQPEGKHKGRGQTRALSPPVVSKTGEWQAPGERLTGTKSPTQKQQAGKTREALGGKTVEGSFCQDTDNNAGNNSEHNKGLGYNVAKSIAYRAYRFNEIWSINGIRYLNLACFLMTIICLATILILSSGKTNLTSITVGSQVIGRQRSRDSQSASRLASGNQSGPELSSESLESVAREPLVGWSAGNKQPDDDFNVSDGEPLTESTASQDLTTGRSSVKRRLAEQDYDNEASGTTTANTSGTSTNEPPTETGTTSDSWPTPSLARFSQHTAGSPMDPILSQILQDMDFGHMFASQSGRDTKPLASTSTTTINGTSGAPITFTSTVLKPIIRRNKNGATIIIRGSSSSAGTSFGPRSNESAAPSAFMERLLPPWMRPTSLQHPVMSMMMMMRPSGLALGDEPQQLGSAASETLEQVAGLTKAHSHPGHYPQRQMIGADLSPFRPPLSMPMMPFMMPPMMAAAPTLLPPGLMGLLMRSQMLGDDSAESETSSSSHELDGEELPQAHETSQSNDTLTKNTTHLAPSASGKANNLTLKTQGKQQTVEGSPDSLLESLMMMADTPVEMSHRQPAMKHALFSGPFARASSPLGSMFIVSARNSNGSNSPSPTMHPMGLMGPLGLPTPFMRPPQMVFLSGQPAGEPLGLSPPLAGLSPMMRSIISTVISDIQNPPAGQSSAGESSNKNISTSQRPSISAASPTNLSPSWSLGPHQQPPAHPSSPAPIDPDDEWTGIGDSIDRWDESSTGLQQHGRSLRARHRDLETEGPMDEPSFALEPMLSVQNHEQLGSLGESSLGTASIRQSIRGPGVTLERVIEVPARGQQRHNPEMVPMGVRSQSLSRFEKNDDSEPGVMQNRMSIVHRRPIFGSPVAPHRSDELEQTTGLIGRLLNDLTKPRADEGQTRTGRSRSASDDDLEEGDSSGDELVGPSSWAPRIRMATARIRMRPLFAEQRSSSGGLPVFAPARIDVPLWNSEMESSGPMSMRSHQLVDEQSGEPQESIVEPASTKPAHNGQKPQQVERQQLRPRGMPPNQPLPVASPLPRMDGENPFTSPSSPLFGFPSQTKPKKDTKQLTSTNNEKDKDKDLEKDKDKTKELDSQGPEPKQTFRRQKSFVYHPNTEPAVMFNPAKAIKPSTNNDQDISPRSRSAEMSSILHSQSFGKPANIVMGRRLDDQPVDSEA